VNKLIVAGIVIVILGLISFLAIGFVNNTNQILEERNKESNEQTKNISTDTKQSIIFTGTYEDLLRHENEHVGKIAVIQGYVTKVDSNNGKYYFEVYGATNSGMERHYVQGYAERLLRDDFIFGYGTYTGICTEDRRGDPFTCFSNVRLFAYDFDNASNGDYGVCTDPIATKFSLCNQ
jgi:hypothetical protein